MMIKWFLNPLWSLQDEESTFQTYIEGKTQDVMVESADQSIEVKIFKCWSHFYFLGTGKCQEEYQDPAHSPQILIKLVWD